MATENPQYRAAKEHPVLSAARSIHALVEELQASGTVDEASGRQAQIALQAAAEAFSAPVADPAKQVAAMTAALGGIDALVFTAGIGENAPVIRRRICEACAWLGIELDAPANDGRQSCITRAGSPVSAWVVPTNEELMIARHTGQLLGLATPQ